MSKTTESFRYLAELSTQLLSDQEFITQIETVAGKTAAAYRKGNKTIFCGNGGSAAEAQHLAAELSGRFNMERSSIPAEACHVNPSFVTAVSNDYNFTKVYARYIDAFGMAGDVLFGLSTSGTSPNIVEAFKMAREKGLITVAFTGKTGGELNKWSDYIFKVPSEITPRIQEIHLLIGHIICEQVEKELFGNA
ncbi:MAG: SIS domain-containing protein [Draconibacterium sp.]